MADSTNVHLNIEAAYSLRLIGRVKLYRFSPPLQKIYGSYNRTSCSAKEALGLANDTITAQLNAWHSYQRLP